MKPGDMVSLEPHDGSRYFVAKDRIAPEMPLLGAFPNTEDGERRLWAWVSERFAKAVEFRRPETERLKMCELYYAGFHYKTPQENRAYKVTNLCFSTVETVHPVMTEIRPRPEIAPRVFSDPSTVLRQQEAAEWWMDSTEFDMANHLVCRDKLKYGWGLWVIEPDLETGIARPRAKPVWDYYPQAGARADEELQHFFDAHPIDTDYLRSLYPEKAHLIQPDGIASSGYDVLERPYQDAFDSSGGYDTIETRVASHATFEGQTDHTSTSLVPDGSAHTDWNTTFLVTMFVRDYATMSVKWAGDIAERDPASPSGTYTYTPDPRGMETTEPCCENGWRMIRYTASGVLLESSALDKCFNEPPYYRDVDYAQNGRFWGFGELDHIIPINRSINERYNLLNHSLRFETSPILTADIDTGIDFDRREVAPGDVLKKLRGSQIQWLDFRGAQAGQFELLGQEKIDMDTVSGVHDVQQGRRPVGIEAASAIRNLQEAAQTRIRGKEVPQFITLAKVLKAGLICTARKAKVPILTRGPGAVLRAIDPHALMQEFDVRFVQGSGTAVGRAMKQDETLTLMGSGLLDAQSAIERLAIPGGQQILERLSAMAPPPSSTPEAA